MKNGYFAQRPSVSGKSTLAKTLQRLIEEKKAEILKYYLSRIFS